LLFLQRHKLSAKGMAGLVAASCAGAAAILLTFQLYAGDALAFIHARSGWNDFTNSSFVANLQSSAGQVRRYVSNALRFSAGLLPVSLGVWMDVLVPGLIAISWRWSRILAVGGAILYLASLWSGGMDSQARYMMVILPAWLGALAVLRKYRATWIVVAIAVPAGLLANMLTLTKFATGGWGG